MADQDATLEKVRKLLAKAEAEGVTEAEAEALTAKAADLMARYGIDQALLAAARPSSDQLTSRQFTVENPWAQVRACLLGAIFGAMRCQTVELRGREPGVRVHAFGYTSDLDRAELLYASLLIQMHRGLAAQTPPPYARSPRAWRRSWMLGFVSAVAGRVQAAEKRATAQADASGHAAASAGRSAALVLADRSVAVRAAMRQEYPRVRTASITYSGSGYGDGRAAGERADIGGARVGSGSARALGR